MRIPPPSNFGREALSHSELEAFLGFLFKEVAKRPSEIVLTRAFAVARYLRTLAFADLSASAEGWEQGTLSETQQAAQRLSELIWTQALLFASGRSARSGEVLAYIREHRDTYLASSPFVERVQALVSSCEIPPDTPDIFEVPTLMSRSMSQSGGRESRITDDLSERIYAGYQALRQSDADVGSASGRVADVLQRSKIPTRSKARYSTEWTADAVREVVKRFERRLRETLEMKEEQVAANRRILVQIWLSRFRLDRALQEEDDRRMRNTDTSN